MLFICFISADSMCRVDKGMRVFFQLNVSMARRFYAVFSFKGISLYMFPCLVC